MSDDEQDLKRPFDAADVAAAVFVLSVTLYVGATVFGQLQPDNLCASELGDNWTAVGNGTLRDQHDATVVCEAPNGTREPVTLGLKNASGVGR